MFQSRFDTRLILILSAMGLLAVMVGVAAVVVNRYVIQSHDTLIQSNLPRIQLASEIGADVEFVGTVSTAFVRADTRADLDRMVARLGDAVDRIEAGASVCWKTGKARKIRQICQPKTARLRFWTASRRSGGNR
ncbi:hypothetical protein QTA57_14220 [Fontisubflavum oceani]|uniref:hypothetical protein n=1 Tax=Fontisubflavum oceani TaxID=2978973 RepID=UPI0025B559E5|nr:hypothetical protein [Fontisubflavum oceani]WJY20951.1 hypothetical protein QTA57_14220 [Fontisubflavum oceani]